MTDAIRPYVPADEAEVVTVWYRAGRAVYTFLPTWQAFTRDQAHRVFVDLIVPSCAVWVGTCDERVVAYLALKANYIDRAIFLFAHNGTSLAAYPTSRPVLQAGGDG